jgi:long-chain acyl-CoA synthetase
VDKVWIRHYEKGVPAEIDADAYQSLIHMFNSSCEQYTKRIAFTHMGVNVSYAQMNQLVECFAGYLQEKLKVKKGDRVGIMVPNMIQYPIAMFAALKTGAMVVNFNPLYTADEVTHQIQDSGVKVMLVMTNFASVLQEALTKVSVEHVIVTQLGDMLNWPKKQIVNFVVKNIKKLIPAWNIPGAIDFNDALSEGKSCTFSPVDVVNSDIAFLQYTGGTTGVAKGAMLTHRNLIANVEQTTAWIKPQISDDDFIVTALPLYHVFSLLANCLDFFKLGGRNLLITNPRDIPAFVKELTKYPVTAITGVNTLFNALLNNSSFAKIDFSKLHVTLGSGTAVQRPVAERWQQVTGKPLVEAYGLTETAGAACINPINTPEYNSFIGLPICSTEVSIRDDAGTELGFDVPGELCIKGPQVMLGYWQRPEETKAVLTDDLWLRTGDIATINHDGYVKIVDRKKDMIIVSGFNVYPNEIEDVIAGCAGVKEVAVVGVPSSVSGESVKAFIVPQNDTVTKADIMQYCREHLTGYKRPRSIEFRSELPKTAVGKILRRALRDEERNKEKQPEKSTTGTEGRT